MRQLRVLLALGGSLLISQPSLAAEIHIAPNWRAVDRVSVSAVTVQDCPEPPMRRGHPLHEAIYRALANLDVDYARLQPWQPYPHLSVAELRAPSAGKTYWDFGGMDEVVADFMAAAHGRPVVFSLSAIPAWMLDPDAAAPPADPDAIDWAYDQGVEKISDRTVQLYAKYQARLAGWYLKGGFRDEAGVWHASGHHYKVAYWEPLSEPAYSAKDIVRLYDASVRAVRKVAPQLRFAGPAFEDVLSDPDAVAYFLDPSHHAPGTPIDLVTYHWYSQPPSDEPLAAAPYGLFARADAFITAAGYVQTMTANGLPGAKTAVNELGSTLPAPTAPKLWQPIPPSYWAMSGAMWAYIYGHLAHTGVSMLGAAEIFDYPGQFASASLLDWDTGQPNARYWVVKLLRDNFGPGDQVVRAEPETDFLKPTPNVQVYAQAFVTPAGVRKVLLVNKRDAPAEVKVLGAAGGDVQVVDGSTKAPPERQGMATGRVSLSPFAVAVVSLPAHAAPEPLSSDSPLRAILADADAKRVLAEMFPAIIGSKNLDQALDQSLRTLQVVAPSYITDKKLEAFDRRLSGGVQ